MMSDSGKDEPKSFTWHSKCFLIPFGRIRRPNCAKPSVVSFQPAARTAVLMRHCHSMTYGPKEERVHIRLSVVFSLLQNRSMRFAFFFLFLLSFAVFFAEKRLLFALCCQRLIVLALTSQVCNFEKSSSNVAYPSFIRVQEVYTINVQIFFFFCINILITSKNPYMRPLLLQIIVWGVKVARNGKTVHD